MKNLLLLTLLTSAIFILPNKNFASEGPLVIEVFTYKSSRNNSCGSGPMVEDEFHYADGTHKPGAMEHIAPDVEAETASIDQNNPADVIQDIPVKRVEEVFVDLTEKHENAIALQYLSEQSFAPGIMDVKKTRHLNDFFIRRHYIYRKNTDLLDQFSNLALTIGGQYQSQGNMEHVVNAAINLHKSETMPSEIKLKLEEGRLQMDIPATDLPRNIELTLVGYHQKKKQSQFPPQEQETYYINAVSDYKDLQSWNGLARQETISVADMDADGFALLAQDSRTGRIFAAGKVEKPIHHIQ